MHGRPRSLAAHRGVGVLELLFQGLDLASPSCILCGRGLAANPLSIAAATRVPVQACCLGTLGASGGTCLARLGTGQLGDVAFYAG